MSQFVSRNQRVKTRLGGAHKLTFCFTLGQCHLVVSACFQTLSSTMLSYFPKNAKNFKIKIVYLLSELLYYYNVPLNGCSLVLSLSSLKKNGVGWCSDDPSFLEPLRGGCGLVKS